MIVHGYGPGARLLREALTDVPGEDITWGHRGMDGLEQLHAFRDAGIACPVFTTSLETAMDWIEESRRGNFWLAGSPVVHSVWGRLRNHTRGTDIVPYGHRLFSRRDFWVRVIPGEAREYRVHVWKGRAFRTGVKVQTGSPVRRTRISNLPVRNDRNGWDLKYSQSLLDSISTVETRKRLRSLAVKAVRAVGYMGGGVDLLITETNEIYVLEVNSAPALGPLTLGAYVRAITASQTEGE